MAQSDEVVHVSGLSVACDGGGGQLGHPRVYLAIDRKTGHVDCPYCGQRFVSDGSHESDH